MTRVTWLVVFLLVASNAAWFLGGSGTDGSAEGRNADREAQERTIAELRTQVATLEGAKGTQKAPSAGSSAAPGFPDLGPRLDGVGPGPAVAEGEEGTGDAEDPEAARVRAAQQETRARVVEMFMKVAQIKDPALRQEGLDELATCLESDDPLLVEYALGAIWGMRGMEVDKEGFRGLVQGLLDSESAGVRRSALYVLPMVEPDAASLSLALSAANDPDATVRSHAARLLKMYTGGKLQGEASAAIVALLGEEASWMRKAALRGLEGTWVTPEIERALIAMAQDPAMRPDAVQHGLSTIQNKSRNVVDALFTGLLEGDHRLRRRAHWGLQRGVPDEIQPYVAKRYAENLEEFVNATTHREALQIIARHGNASMAADVDRLAQNTLVTQKIREAAAKVAAYLREKKPVR